MQLLTRECRRRGAPLTPQREAVYADLQSRRDHPTADRIHARLRSRLPGLSRATVYRILAGLVRWGLARRVLSGERGARFDGNVERHDHVLCDRCGRMDDCPAVRVSGRPRRLDGFRIRDHSVVFTGLCRSCNRKER